MAKREHIIFNPEMECMSRDERTDLQNERLRQVVRHEYDNVPVYRARMDDAGVKPEDIRTIEDLRYLPFTEKTDLRDQFPYGLLAVDRSEIVRIHDEPVSSDKSFTVRITDGELIGRTGGIVQGMSGSPIIQDGKLVGAVTHVLVNDPTMGYGISIGRMLDGAA